MCGSLKIAVGNSRANAPSFQLTDLVIVNKQDGQQLKHLFNGGLVSAANTAPLLVNRNPDENNLLHL